MVDFLTPGDCKISDKSDLVNGNFGGNRSVSSNNSKSQDYLSPSGAASNIKENPVDDTIRDVDDMTDPKARKREFSYQEDKANVQLNNEADFISQSDLDRLPPEDTDAFTPDGDLVKLRRSKLKNQFGSGQYDNNPNRGYEGEMS